MVRLYNICESCKLTFRLKEHTTCVFSHAPDTQYTNETLAHHGFIGVTPDTPVIAISFKCFEIYHQLHHVCPRFSFHTLSASLAHLHQVNVPFLVMLQLIKFSGLDHPKISSYRAAKQHIRLLPWNYTSCGWACTAGTAPRWGLESMSCLPPVPLQAERWASNEIFLTGSDGWE